MVQWTGNIGCTPPMFHVTIWPRTRGRIASSQPTDREIEMFLRLGIRALSKLTGRLLEGGNRNSDPLR